MGVDFSFNEWVTGDLAKLNEEIKWLINNDPIVFSAYRSLRISMMHGVNGIDETTALKALVVILTEGNRKLINELVRLESIAPKLITLPSGKVMRWDAPDEFVEKKTEMAS